MHFRTDSDNIAFSTGQDSQNLWTADIRQVCKRELYCLFVYSVYCFLKCCSIRLFHTCSPQSVLYQKYDYYTPRADGIFVA
jgi:hypothetical protein